jgi:hypothetical protein
LGECGIIDLDFNDGEWSVVRRPLGNVELLTLTLIMGSGPWGVGECGIIDLDSIVPIQPETIGLRFSTHIAKLFKPIQLKLIMANLAAQI